MATIKVEDKSIEVGSDTRLAAAIEQMGINIGHRCGGKAKCTTCRVSFIAGEPEAMTRAEHEKLVERDLLGSYRLSCQILCEHDMELRVGMTLESEGWSDTGPELAAAIPEAEWHTKAELDV